MADEPSVNDALVDDGFWLRRAGQMILAGASAPNIAANQLMTAVAWFWTAYTAATVVGVAVADRDLGTGRLVLLVLPGVLLICAYSLAMFASMPVDVEFDPAVPREVADAHVSGVMQARRRLRYALITTLVAAVSVVGALLATSA